MKNEFLQDVYGPTSHYLSNGPSLNRILVFQDYVGGDKGSYVFNSLISVSFLSRLIRLYGLNQSSNILKVLKVYQNS